VDELRDKGPPDISLAICGNKVDLVEHRQVDEFEARSFAAGIGGFYMEVSARDNINITELFEEIARRAPTKDDDGDHQSTNIITLAESRQKSFWSSWC
jgi:GTPase SAR1 family protein